MKIVCAKSVLLGHEAFSDLGTVLQIPEGEISKEHLKNADVLITRSKVQINQQLLEGTPLKYFGTATAGFDHVDTEALANKNIPWKALCSVENLLEDIE